MEPMTYGEMVADKMREGRAAAERERAGSRRSIDSTPVLTSVRIFSGRLLVNLGERVAGCAELARGEVKPSVRLVG